MSQSPTPSVPARLTRVQIGLVGALLILAAAGIWSGFLEARVVQALSLLVLAGLASAGVFLMLQPSPAKLAQRPSSNAKHLIDYFSNSSDGLALVDPFGDVTFSNPAFRLLLGGPDGPTGSFVPVQVFGSLRGGREAAYRFSRAAASGLDWEEVIEQTGKKPEQGPGCWLRVSLRCHSGANSAAFTSWRVSDATNERSKQGEVLQSLRRNLEHLDLLPAGLFSASPEGRITYMNATLASWLGLRYGIDEARQLTLNQVVQRDISSPAAGYGEEAETDVQLLQPDGKTLPARLLARAGLGAGSSTVAGLLLPGAVSDQRPGNSATSEAHFSRLFQAAPIAIAAVDGTGRIGSANPAFQLMFFDPPNQAKAPGSNLLDLLHVDCLASVRSALLAAQKGERPGQPVEITFGTGARRAGQLFLSTHQGQGPNNGGVVLYALETTERKELEAQFAQSQKMQAIGQLAGGIAHDINNVLTVIIGFSDLLLANSAGDPAFHDLNEIKANANRAANLVRQLLAFSRRQTLRPEVLSLNETISDLTVFLKRSLGEKVKLERDYGRDLWLVKADQTELGRVLVNLAVNAVDAMPNGGTLTIRTSNVPCDDVAKLALTGLAPADYVLCQVADTGHGMSAEVLEKIFEPFFTTKEVGKGTGLGLSTVYGIVKQTGGYIYCDSQPGVGTNFRIFLPRHTAGAVNVERDSKVEKKDRPRDLTGTGTILLVEDEESVRRFAARALRRQGYAVLEAGNGQEALEVKAAHPGMVDLVVSDIVMPEMDGPTLLKELRRTNPDLKIIFMSGYADDALSSLDGGEEFAFLSKPFQLTDLVAAVKGLMPP